MSLLARIGVKDPKLESLAMWKDPKVSGAVMVGAAGLYVLLELSSFTVVEMVATLGLIVTIAGAVWGYVAGYLGKSGMPVPEVMTSGISEDCARKMIVETALPVVNKGLACTASIIKGENLALSMKLAVYFFLVAKIGHYMSLCTFTFLALVKFMTIPKLYATYQTEIDKAIDQAMTKINEFKKLVLDKLEPVLSKLPKAKSGKSE